MHWLKINSQKILTVFSAVPGDQMVVMPFLEGNPHQRWAFHVDKISKINLPADCIDITRSEDKDGALVIEYPSNGTSNQQWYAENIMPA
jgi:hypothetical protein